MHQLQFKVTGVSEEHGVITNDQLPFGYLLCPISFGDALANGQATPTETRSRSAVATTRLFPRNAPHFPEAVVRRNSIPAKFAPAVQRRVHGLQGAEVNSTHSPFQWAEPSSAPRTWETAREEQTRTRSGFSRSAKSKKYRNEFRRSRPTRSFLRVASRPAFLAGAALPHQLPIRSIFNQEQQPDPTLPLLLDIEGSSPLEYQQSFGQ